MTTPHFPEDPTAIPDPLTPREHVIRAIHQFADYLTAHPETPAPRTIEARYFIRPEEEAVEAVRVAAVAAWAERTGARLYETVSSFTAELPVVRNTHVTIEYVYGAHLRRPEQRRYLGKADGQ